jgi:hypothetical protein
LEQVVDQFVEGCTFSLTFGVRKGLLEHIREAFEFPGVQWTDLS